VWVRGGGPVSGGVGLLESILASLSTSHSVKWKSLTRHAGISLHTNYRFLSLPLFSIFLNHPSPSHQNQSPLHTPAPILTPHSTSSYPLPFSNLLLPLQPLSSPFLHPTIHRPHPLAISPIFSPRLPRRRYSTPFPKTPSSPIPALPFPSSPLTATQPSRLNHPKITTPSTFPSSYNLAPHYQNTPKSPMKPSKTFTNLQLSPTQFYSPSTILSVRVQIDVLSLGETRKGFSW